MSSGSAGMTRNTLETSDRNSSHSPPRYAAATPTMTDSAVATMPTTAASSRVSRMPTSIWESTSWPLWVVPSRWAELGAARDRLGLGFW
jgi:hypothetical protein